MRKQDGAWFGALAALLAGGYALFRRRLTLAAALGVDAAGLGVASRHWSRNSRGPFPYSLRWILALPHPISPGLLRQGVEPAPGDQVLEIGSGTGRHAVQVAWWIAPAGTLDVFDVQQDMLDAVMRRADDEAITNITPTRGQASDQLPYPDGRFDAAYLITVIGEIPDQDAALRELRRVVRPAVGSRSVKCCSTPTTRHHASCDPSRRRVGSGSCAASARRWRTWLSSRPSEPASCQQPTSCRRSGDRPPRSSTPPPRARRDRPG
jgi:SAM-dependent methyltransferase